MAAADSSTPERVPAAIDSDRYLSLFESLSPLVGSHQLDEIAPAACRLAARVLQVANCSILLHDPAREGLRLVAATHIAPGEWDSVCLPLETGLCGECFTRERSILLASAADFLKYGMTPSGEYGHPSCVVAPLIIDGRPQGVINIAHPGVDRPFNAEDVRLIEAAARLIGAGIENARRFAESRRHYEQLESILESLHIAVMALDETGRVTHLNQRLRDFLGLGSAQVRGRNLLGLFDVRIGNVCKRLIREAGDGATIGQDRVHGRVGDREIDVQITVSPLGPAAGGERLVMLEDISRDQEFQRLVEADSAKRAFLRIISHELRTPLTVIQGALPLLRDAACAMREAGDGRLEKVERLVGANVRKMTSLVNTILDVVQIENGTMTLSRAPFNLNKLLAGLTEGRAEFMKEKNLDLETDYEEGLPDVNGDRLRIQQALCELLQNAIKFAEPGSTVRLITRRRGAAVQVEIADRGKPIAADEREEVFEKFHQLDQSVARATGGCGLGLYLARSIARLHGGELEIVEGRPGETVFRATLPLIAGA